MENLTTPQSQADELAINHLFEVEELELRLENSWSLSISANNDGDVTGTATLNIP